MIETREYLSADGRSPFAEWLDGLDARAALKVNTAVKRIQQGNLSNVKTVGTGVHELRIDFGPGYRIYFASDGEKLIILLGGGSKKRQARDIEDAHARWADYKKRKQKGE